jgi:two-component system sensor histidine kinase KdpD
VADLAREVAGAHTKVDAPDEALVEGDERLIAMALRNLLDNARKYSGREAQLVRLTRAGELMRLAVIDDGPGLDEEARRKMFDRYWRADKETAGTGLGLALVRAVAQRHGGQAEAIPNTDGPGLEVAFTLGPVAGWYDGPARL